MAAIITCSSVSRTFLMGEASIEVLRDVNLTVNEGEFLAIEGRSGSGKSTLLHILAGLDTPTHGSVTFGEHDLAELGRRSRQHMNTVPKSLPFGRALETMLAVVTLWTDFSGLRLSRIRNESFGVVFQFYHLLPELNVLENAMLAGLVRGRGENSAARRSTLRERAVTILDSLGMGHRLTHRPNQLSGGERQRVAIARALMNEPRVLFADEPTGNLDAETGGQIMRVLEQLHQERKQTIVMVTHDRTIARRADRVLVMKNGRLE